VNTYVINAGAALEKLDSKVKKFLPQLEAHINDLCQRKPVIWTGDLNVAHQDIDIFTPDGHEKIAGFTPQERGWFDTFLKSGFHDVFRELYPDKQQFSFFSFKGNERARNHGWRIDYFIVSESFARQPGLIADCTIDSGVDCSDHSPVSLVLDRDKLLTADDRVVSGSFVEVIGAKARGSLMNFFSLKTKPA
jgi:exodeoxyribonuclease III